VRDREQHFRWGNDMWVAAVALPRKVYFFPVSGRVMMKKLVRVKNDTLIAREREYEARLRRDNVQGDVELFG